MNQNRRKLMKQIGKVNANYHILTSERIDSKAALRMNLVADVFAKGFELKY